MAASGRPYPWEKSYPPGMHWDLAFEPVTLDRILTASARFGERPAIDYAGRRVSYAALARHADAFAAALLRRGVGPGHGVALYLPNTPCHPVAFFGAIKAGARVVHLSPLDAERELAHKLADSGARTLVCGEAAPLQAMAARLRAAGAVDCVIVDRESFWGGPAASDEACGTALPDFLAEGAAGPPDAWPRLSVDDIAVLQYTGGTTGTPKGAMLSHRNIAAALASIDAWIDGQGMMRPGEEIVICVLPLFHIYALTTVLLRHLQHGNLILLRPRFGAGDVLADIEERRATVFPGVPTMWMALAAHPGIEARDLSSLRLIGSGAAPLPVEIERRIERLTGRKLVGGWGMTETSPAGTGVPLVGGPPGTIGLPLPGIVLEVVAVDEPRRVLGAGETGELRIKGANVTRGYWNQPAETAAAFIDGFLLTGDIGYRDANGFFFLVDRKKEMIISGGFNVYPRIIEDAIYEEPRVAEATVIGIADPYRGEAAKAFITLKPGARPFTLEELRAFLADKLGRHELPAALEFRDRLPRTPAGKLSRKELIAEERARAGALPGATQGVSHG